MKDLYNKLKNYTIKDAIKFEENDRQFLALEELYKNKKMSNENYLFLIIANSLISYQLSWKWEEYWEEFSSYLEDKNIKTFWDLYDFFEKFLPKSKNNKRFIETKLKRIKKLEKFPLSKTFLQGEKGLNAFKYYYKNMDKLALDLSKVMDQNIEAKTIVFAVKMFSYWARNVFWYLEYFPENLMIPIDSRLENLYKKYKNKEVINKKEVKEFYINLSKKLNIPLLNLDAILWVNYGELIDFIR